MVSGLGPGISLSKKLAYGDLFRQGGTVCLLAIGPHRCALRASGLRYWLRRCPRPSVRFAHPHGSPGGRRRKETLLTQGFRPYRACRRGRITVGGLRPSDAAQGLFDKLVSGLGPGIIICQRGPRRRRRQFPPPARPRARTGRWARFCPQNQGGWAIRGGRGQSARPGGCGWGGPCP